MRIRTLLALMLLALHAAPAHAAPWWWDYFDGLTGPGPFRASVPSGVEFRVWSFSLRKPPENPERSRKIQLLADSPNLKWFAVVRYVGMDNDWEVDHQHENFKGSNGEAVRVELRTLDVAIMRRLLEKPALDLGAGVSLLRVSGDTFDPQYRVGPIVKLTLAPLSPLARSNSIGSMLARVPKVYADFVAFDGFTGGDFGNPAVMLPDVERKFRAGVLLDVTPLLCKARSKNDCR